MSTTFDRMNKLANLLIKKIETIPKNDGERSKYYFQRLDIGKAMVEVGYSPSYAQNRNEPQGLLNKKTFKELLAEKITTSKVLNIQQTNLNANTLSTISVDASFTEKKAKDIASRLNGEFAMFSSVLRGKKTMFLILPYYKIRDMSLDKLYKLAGDYSADKLAVITRPFDQLSDEELAKQIAEGKKRFNK